MAVLDVYPEPTRALIRSRLPAAWHCAFADGYDDERQLAALHGADVAFANWWEVRGDTIRAVPGLRLIHKLGAGVDKIDQAACRERGVRLARISGGNAVPVAEHTLLLILAALRRLPEIDARTRAGEWFKEEARVIQRQLAGRTVGLLGLGAIGQAVARRLAGFDVEIVYHDPNRLPRDVERDLGVRYLDLEALLATSDVLSLHLPLLPGTRGLLGAERIRTLKPGAVVVNCARGGLIDENALADALRSGHVLAAGLDTFAAEPLRDSPLPELANTVLTAHVAGATLDNFGQMVDRAVANTLALREGRPIPDGDLVI
ncbi:2-hydroxyacid dehydrogenase [Streptomyces profundus]|uniref:2-hydroxyacid dehydrogenase n=1 Tax=Streptomyces profundus TaxID=2867410 RepID=UPI001D15F761|nr:2-hydroxyacid dehydrogenase [Streptomyces sp. MA3_2.13]UED84696.1 2-hydroxyacid dehydrogenase [Streptomyces sp. MA3_2.13]